MNRTVVFFLVALSLLCLVNTALADALHVVINSSFHGSFSKNNDNYENWYTSTGTQVPANFDGSGLLTTFQNFSYVLPAGSVVTSAMESVNLSSSLFYGTGYVFVAGGVRCVNPDKPCVAPTFEPTATSYLNLDSIYWVPVNGRANTQTFGYVIVDGNTVSTGDMNIYDYDFFGTVMGTVLTPGSNWSGYIGGVADITVPYTVTMDVQYTTPVAEPSAFVLSATGMLGALGGIARRRFRR